MINVYAAPCCKPLRLIELFGVTLCFTLMFFTRIYICDCYIPLPDYALLILFVTFGTLFLVGGFDVLLQSIRHPTSNIPMILVTTFGALSCFSAGVLLMVFYHIKLNSENYRTLNVVALLAGGSFFLTTVYFIDTIILIRFL